MMRIRPAKKSDIAGMSLLLTQLFSIESDFTPDEKKQAQGLSLLLDARGAHILVAEEESRVIAMATVQILVSTAEGGHVGLIEDVVVDEAYRSRGIGRKMMEFAMAICRQQGCYKLVLSSNLQRERAHAFYENLGFKKHGYSFMVEL